MRILIVGGGQAGGHLAEQFCADGHDVVVVDTRADALSGLESRLDLMTVCGSGADPEVLERAKKAFAACGVEPVIVPIRGGTDGARLSYMGLPCPNLSTGGYNFHGRKEMIPVPAMEKMVEVLESVVCSL